MPYPNLPWILKGEGPLIGGLFRSDIDRLRAILPQEVTPISVLPGKTIGAFYFCKFGPGSEIEYNGFVVFPAFVKYISVELFHSLTV
jgi:hypothetical protein